MTSDPSKHPNLAPLQALCDQQRAIAVMKRYGCYVVPTCEFSSERIESPMRWRLRTKDGYNFGPDGLCISFPTPEAALCAAGEYLDSRQGKDGGE